jgi:taurine transport system permease protein
MYNIAGLTFAYKKDFPVFRDFNWNIAQGERWSIIGPSGCGKTTLLYLLAGLRAPASGNISLSDCHINGQVLGVPLGFWLGQNRSFDKCFYPLIYITYPIPKVALLPVIILFRGIGHISKVFLITLVLFFQVLVIVRYSSRNIPTAYELSLRSLGTNRFQLLESVYLSAYLTATLTSLRLNVTAAIAGLYLAESFATNSGLGYRIVDTWQRLDYPRMYAGVLAMSLVGAEAFVGLGAIEGKLCRCTQAGKQKQTT